VSNSHSVTVIGGLVIAATLSACGASGPGAPHATTTKAAPSTPGSTPPTTSAADVALARSELLPASAFPTGWTGQGPGSENSGASFFGGGTPGQVAEMISCLGISATDVNANPAEAGEQQYDDPKSNVTVTNTVDVFPTAAQAAKDAGAALNVKAPSCLVRVATSLLKKGVPKGAVVGRLTVTPEPIPRYGQRDVALVIHFPFSYQGVSATLYIEEVLVQQGRSESNLQFINTGSPPPAAVVDQLVTAAASRLTPT
jgi:hypothetical protein